MISEQPRQATWKVLAARHLAAHYPDRAIQLLREARPRRRATRDARPAGERLLPRRALRDGGGRVPGGGRVGPEGPLAWFNLARVRLATFQFPGAEEAMRQARALSKRTVARLERELPQAEVADPEFGAVEVARQVVAGGAFPGAGARCDSVTRSRWLRSRRCCWRSPSGSAPAARARSPARAAATRPAPAARRGSATTEPVSAAAAPVPARGAGSRRATGAGAADREPPQAARPPGRGAARRLAGAVVGLRGADLDRAGAGGHLGFLVIGALFPSA